MSDAPPMMPDCKPAVTGAALIGCDAWLGRTVENTLCGDSSNVELPLIQGENGGSHPTSPLQFKLMMVSRQAINPIIQRFHYSRSTDGVNGVWNFGLSDSREIIGGAIVGQPATPNVAEKYNQGGKLKVAELRRFCLCDSAPKNTESYFLSKIAWWMRKNTDIDLLISFADETYGHKGTIYKAANWREIGESAPEKKIEWRGKRYHRRALAQKNRPQQTAAIKAALESGEARMIQTGKKRVFAYTLVRPNDQAQARRAESVDCK